MSIEDIGSYEEIYGNTLSQEDMTNLDAIGVEWRGRNIYDIQDNFHLKIVELAYRALENTAQTNPGALLKIKADLIELFQAVFTEDDDEDEISSLLYHYDPISGTYQELIAAQGKLKDAIKKTGKVCAKVVKSDIKARKKAVKDIVKVKGKIEKPILKAEAKVNDWIEEHPVQAAVIGVAIVATVVTAGLASSAIAGAVEAAVGSAETIGSSVGAVAGTAAAAAGAAATASANNRSESDQDIEEKPKSSPSSSTPSQNIPPSVNSGVSSQPVNSITSDSAIANPSVPQPVNPNFKPSHNESFIEKVVGTTKYIIAEEVHEARQTLGDLRVEAAALGNKVTDILNPILPSSVALPKKNLEDIQKETLAAHQKLDEFFEIPLSNKYDSDHVPLIEKREAVTGTIPLPGISVLTKAGKAGKIAKAVETAGALGEGIIAEENVLLNNRPISIVEKVTVTENRVRAVANNALTKGETLSSGAAAETEASSAGFVGSRNFQLKQPEFQKISINPPTKINERLYSGHAIDKMQLQGIQPSLVEDVIKNGQSFVGKEPNTKAYFYEKHNITVILNENGDVITTSFGNIKQQ